MSIRPSRYSLSSFVILCTLLLAGCGGDNEVATTQAPVTDDILMSDDSVPVNGAPTDQSGESPNSNPDTNPETPTVDSPATGDPTDQNPGNGTTNQPPLDAEVPDSVSIVDPDGPTSPSNLRGVAYTESEIEIFWDRASVAATVVEYQIWRDGEWLETRDGLSFYESQLQPATTFQYDVYAVDEQGRAGQPATLFLATPELSLTITNENALARLEYLVSVINEETFGDFANVASAVSNFSYSDAAESMAAGFELIDIEFTQAGSKEIHRCVASEGEMTRFRSAGAQQYVGSGDFTDCSSSLVGGARVDGGYKRLWTLVKYVYNGGSSAEYDFPAMSITADDGYVRSVTGSNNLFNGSRSYNSWDKLDDATPFAFTRQSFEGTTFVNDLSMMRRAGVSFEDNAEPWSRNLEASFSVQSPQTGNKPLQVETPERFITFSHDSCFEVGSLHAEGEDGSYLTLNADTGDVNTFELEVGNGDSSEVTTHSWTESTIIKQMHSRESEAPATVDSLCAGRYLPTRS